MRLLRLFILFPRANVVDQGDWLLRPKRGWVCRGHRTANAAVVGDVVLL